MPTVGSVHVNVPLSNLAIRYRHQPVVADMIFPVIDVKKKADVYYKFRQEELIEMDDRRAPGTEANEIEWDVDNTPYLAETYALRYLLPDEVVENADSPIRPRVTTTRKLSKFLQLGYERRVKDIVFSTAFITETFVPGTKWDATSGANPEKDIDECKKRIRVNSGVEPNSILMNGETGDTVKRWLKLTAYTTYKEYLDVGKLPDRLWDLDVIQGKAIHNTAKRGQTATKAQIWTDNVLVFYKEADPSIETFSLGYTLRSRRWRVKDWREESREGQMYEVSVIQDEVLVAADAGCLMTDVLT